MWKIDLILKVALTSIIIGEAPSSWGCDTEEENKKPGFTWGKGKAPAQELIAHYKSLGPQKGKVSIEVYADTKIDGAYYDRSNPIIISSDYHIKKIDRSAFLNEVQGSQSATGATGLSGPPKE